MAEVITLAAMGIIFVVSVLAGRAGGTLRPDEHSAWAWAALAILLLLLEAYLMLFRHHTLSEQMMWWVKNSRIAPVFFAIFWIWAAYHFIFEPAVQTIKAYLAK